MDTPSRRFRFFAWYVAPILALQFLAVGTLISGQDTLYLRDVMTTHWSGERSLSAAMETGGRLPVLDRARSGGQPATGNPNFLPFYPTTQAYRFGDSLWILNAHFWVHFLLMPWCFFALARTWGLGRESAWAAATLYSWSGFALSQMSYYNLIAAVTWGPLLVASCLWLRRSPSGRCGALTALLWALLLVGGDPTLAALILVAIALAWWIDGSDTPAAQRSWLWLGFGGLLGTLLAAPQLVELWRVLPTSFRSVQGYDGVVTGTFHFRQMIDWLLPTFFGRIDRVGVDGFWGHAYFGGALPLFLSLSPGWLALVLWFGVRWKSPVAKWGVVCMMVGVVASLGALGGLPGVLGGGGLLRFPVKAWLLVALGGAVLGGAVFEGLLRTEEPGTRRRVGWAWGALFLLAVSTTLLLMRNSTGTDFVGRWFGLVGERIESEGARWFLLASAVCAALLWLGGGLALLRRWPQAAGALLLIFHAVTQLGFYGSLVARDRSNSYRSPEQDLTTPHGISAGSHVVHSQVSRLVGWYVEVEDRDDESAAVLGQRAADSLYPFVGVSRGLRYELNPSPEGLDSYFTYLARDAVQKAPPRGRVALLRIWGVEGLIGRPGLEVPGLERGRPVGQLGIAAYYPIENPVPEVRVVSNIIGASGPLEALSEMLGGSFQPEISVVLAGVDSAPVGSVRPRWQTIRSSDDEILVEVDAGTASALVVQWTYQPVYRASIDGESAPVEVADLHRTAVRVPAGTHRVRLWVDRNPLRWAYAIAALAAIALLGWAWLGRETAVGATNPML